jgi:glucokinase
LSEPVAIGIDVGGTKLVAATVAADGRVLERLRRQTPANDEEELVSSLRGLVRQLGPALPVGVGIAGLVSADGVVHYGPNIAVRDLDLAGALAPATDAEVAVVNDASAAALGEQRVGAAQAHEDVVMLTLGTGVGGGLVLGGELRVGVNGFAGELGHIIVEEGGRSCPCGNRGCVEAYAAGTAIGLTARERLVDRSVESRLREVGDLTGKDVTRAALAGDAFAQQVLSDAGAWLGVAIASLTNVFDPELVLLGGGAAVETSRWVVPAAEQALARRIIGSGWRIPPPIELAALGDDAGMVGAALLAAERAA